MRATSRPARLFVTSVGNLQTAGTFALDNDFAVPLAQFDLPNVTAGAVNFFGDQRRALQAAAALHCETYLQR